MNKVLVIGPSYKSEIIITSEKLCQQRVFNSAFYDDLAGGQYSIAYNLAILEVNTFFITRFAYDKSGNEMLANLDKQNVTVSFTGIGLSSTPQKTYLFNQQDGKIFDNITYNCYPSVEDNIPSEFFLNTDYALINIVNSNYLQNIMQHYPHVRYICDNNIPADNLLERIEAIILDIDYICNYVDEKNFADFAGQLLYKGINYLLITNKGKGVYIYTRSGNDYIQKENSGRYYIGCHEVFVSMFLASLSNDMPFSQAVNYALNLANDFSYNKAFKLEKDFF